MDEKAWELRFSPLAQAYRRAYMKTICAQAANSSGNCGSQKRLNGRKQDSVRYRKREYHDWPSVLRAVLDMESSINFGLSGPAGCSDMEATGMIGESFTWGICTRRAGKLYKARSRLHR